MPIDPMGFGQGSSSFDSIEARMRFGKLLNLVNQPQSAVNVERPNFRARLTQDPPGVFQFDVTQHQWPEDSVTFSATTSKDGRFINRLTFGKSGMVITPSQPMAQEIFFNRVIDPLYKFFFGDKA